MTIIWWKSDLITSKNKTFESILIIFNYINFFRDRPQNLHVVDCQLFLVSSGCLKYLWTQHENLKHFLIFFMEKSWYYCFHIWKSACHKKKLILHLLKCFGTYDKHCMTSILFNPRALRSLTEKHSLARQFSPKKNSRASELFGPILKRSRDDQKCLSHAVADVGFSRGGGGADFQKKSKILTTFFFRSTKLIFRALPKHCFAPILA